MPLYDYGCKTCTKEFELRHSHTESSIICLYCGSSEVSKLLRSSNIVTKSLPGNKTEETSTRVEQEIENKKVELKKTKQELLKQAQNDK